MEIAGVHGAEIFFPGEFAGVGVEAEKAFGGENGDDETAVGGGSGVGVGGFGVAFDAGDGFVAEFVEENLSGGAIEGEEAPFVFGLVVGGGDVAVEADFEIGFGAGADGGYDVNAIAPDDRRGVGEAGDGGFPEDIFVTFDVPFGWGGDILIDAAGARAAELRPVGLGVAGASKSEQP